MTDRDGRTAAARALVVLGLVTGVACLPVLWTRLGQRADQRAMWSVGVPDATKVLLQGWLSLVGVEVIGVVLVLAVALAAARRRFGQAVAAVGVVVGANVATQVVKAVLPRPSYGIGADVGNTLPSGHVTVVTSLVLAAVLVVPRAWRYATSFLAAGAATLTGAAVLIERWHRPSDVVAAYAVCAVLAGVAGVAVRRRASTAGVAGPSGLSSTDDSAGSRSTWRGSWAAALLGSVLAGAALIVLGLAPAADEPGPLVGGVVLAAVGVTATVLVALTACVAEAIRAGDGIVGHHG